MIISFKIYLSFPVFIPFFPPRNVQTKVTVTSAGFAEPHPCAQTSKFCPSLPFICSSWAVSIPRAADPWSLRAAGGSPAAVAQPGLGVPRAERSWGKGSDCPARVIREQQLAESLGLCLRNPRNVGFLCLMCCLFCFWEVFVPRFPKNSVSLIVSPCVGSTGT